MIIKDIEAKRVNINGKDSIKIILKSEKSKYEAKIGVSKDSLYDKQVLENDISSINKILREKIKNMKIGNFEDLSKVHEILSSNNIKVDSKSLICIESSILKALSNNKIYNYFIPDIKIIPRPLGIIFGNSATRPSSDFSQVLIFCTETNKFEKAVNSIRRVQELLEKEVKKYDKDFRDEFNSEGALIANLTIFDSLDLITRLCKQVSNEIGVKLNIGINFGSDNLYKDSLYNYKNYSNNERQKSLSRKEQIDFIKTLIERYNLFYIEDPLEKNDAKGYKELRKKLICQIISNNSFENSLESLNKISKLGYYNAVIMKLNRVKSLIDYKNIVNFAKEKNIKIISETSECEPDDEFLANFIVSMNIEIMKYGVYVKDKKVLEEIKKIESDIREKK